jgi:hypothetical protein
VKDELAARRAAKGIVTITVRGGTTSIVRQVMLDAGDTIDPIATLKARRRRKRPKPV